MERSLVADLDDSVLFVGGRLCLDFVNTLCNRLGEPLELLRDVESANRWLAIAGAMVAGESGEWIVSDGERSLARAVELRAALRDLADGVREGRSPSEASVHAVNSVLRANPTYSRLEFDGDAYRETVAVARGKDPWLAAIARDAVDMLCRADPKLLKQCECETCVRLFYDTTKNHGRRWCVHLCGGRVKAAKYYRRKRMLVQTVRSR